MFNKFFLAIVIFKMCSSAWALGDGVFVYDSHARRDPFVSLVGADDKNVVATDVSGVEDINFQGVATNARGELITIINGELFKKGDSLGDAVIKEIKKDSVVVAVQGKDHILKLYE